MTEWKIIDSAPMDGTWLELWRDAPDYTAGYWEPLIYGRWSEEDEAWAWPEETYEVFSDEGRRRADRAVSDGDTYQSVDFTHWRHLPVPPT